MKLVGGFYQFAQRVLEAVKKGGLGSQDSKKLDNLLTRTGTRNSILAKGILTAMSAGGASEKDVSRFGQLLHAAEQKIEQDREPFSKAEKDELQDIFKRAYVSDKAARWFSAQVDELLAEEINEFISGSRRMDLGVPAKKTVKFGKAPAREETEEARKKARV